MGEIVTFYSYKGGVGRTMALANVAVLLSQYGYKTLVVDWDLEAPGLEFFFKDYFPHLDLATVAQQEGVVDLLNDVFENNTSAPQTITIDDYLIELALPNSKRPVYFLTAGRRDRHYFSKVHDLDLEIFVADRHGTAFIEALRNSWKSQFDFILVDSRTGVTDNGQVCTTQLPDVLVLVLTATEQGLNGTIEMVKKTRAARLAWSPDQPALLTLPILSRFDSHDEFESSKQWLDRAAAGLADIYNGWLPASVKPRDFLEVTKIPYQAYFSFGERLPVLEQGTLDPTGLGYAYETLAALIASKLQPVEQLMVNRSDFVDSVKATLEATITAHLATKHWDGAVALLDDETLRAFYYAGRAKTLNEWFSKFPFAELEKHPRLLLWWGQVLNDNFGQAKRAIAFFSLAEEEFRKQNRLVKVAEALIWQSVASRMIGRASEAVTLAEKGLSQLEALAADDKRLLAWATRNRGLAYGTAGHIDQALIDTRNALVQFEALDQRYLVGLCHHDLGVSLEKQAAYREAEAHYRQAIKIWQAMDNDNDLSNSLTHLGGILSKRGEHDEALALLKESQQIALSVGAIRRAAFAIAGIGDTHFRRQAYEEAIKAYRLSTGYAQDAQVQYLEVSNQIQMSDCLYYLNQEEDHAEALRQAEEARATAAAIGLALEEGLAVTIQAKIYIKLGQYQEGIQRLAEAVTYITTNNPVDYVIARLWWAYALWLTDKHADALGQLEQAAQFIPSKNGLPPELNRTVSEVRACLTYFTNQASVSDEVRAGLERLFET